MSNEELNQKMEFIVEQQAQFAADIQITREIQATEAKQFKEEMKLLKEQDRKLTEAVLGVISVAGSLTQAQMRTDESFRLLSEAQARTEESLKILVNVVERHVHGNGGSQSPA